MYEGMNICMCVKFNASLSYLRRSLENVQRYNLLRRKLKFKYL